MKPILRIMHTLAINFTLYQGFNISNLTSQPSMLQNYDANERLAIETTTYDKSGVKVLYHLEGIVTPARY